MHLPTILRTLRSPLVALAVAPLGAQDQDAYRRDLERLTDPALEGRETGTPGGDRAIGYIAEAMEEAGLSPWVQGTFRQDFRLDSRSIAFTDETELLVHGARVSRALELGEDALPFQLSADGHARGPVVFAGYGLRIPELDHDDYAGLDVRGRIVLLLRHAPDWRDPDSPYRAHQRHWDFGAKFSIARSAGAAGILLVDPMTGGEATDLSVARRVRDRAKVPAFLITRRAADLLAGGKDGFLSRERRLLQGLKGALGPLPRVEMELRVEKGAREPGPETANVIGWLRGSDPALDGEYVVVGAHHDHIGRGRVGSFGGPAAVGTIHPGADDNASGVAGLLSLARTMASAPRLRRSVLFVAFGAKEMGHRGSKHFLSECPVSSDRIVAMINLDRIGRASSCATRVAGVGTGRGLEQVLEEFRKATALKLRLDRGTSPPSDHWSFVQRGIPSLLVHTGFHDQYRSPADVSSLVEVEGAREVVRLVHAVVRRLGNADELPAFTGRRCP